MMCLSVRQPWATLIIAGIKNVENRKWDTRLRGALAIHASKTSDQQAMYFLHQIMREDPGVKTAIMEYGQRTGIDMLRLDSYPTGAVIGFVNLIDIRSPGIVDDDHRVWRDPMQHGWVLRSPIELDEKQPLGGRLGLFDVTVKVTRREG